MRVVIVTAHSAIDTAVDAMQAGAADYLVKPCSPDQLRMAAAKQLEFRQLSARLEALEGEVRKSSAGLDSRSPTMMSILETARQVATTDANVLILGESGSGKGELARAIHAWSRRAKKTFVTINCPSLSADLMESEMFGHTRGAFTGASESTLGRVSQADGGTLFLDEIGDFPLALQPKPAALHPGQGIRTRRRSGDPPRRRAHPRRHQPQPGTDGGGKRIPRRPALSPHVIVLNLPPLRERKEDIVDLAERFLARFVKDYNRPAHGFSEAALDALRNYGWPGNVRELRNVIERASIICGQDLVDVNHLGLGDSPATSGAASAPRVGEALSLEALERAHIAAVMATSETLDQAAKTLGIDASTLYRKRKQYGL